MNAMQWAGAVAAVVSLFTFVLFWRAPKGSEEELTLAAFTMIVLITACVLAGFGIAKQTGVIQ